MAIPVVTPLPTAPSRSRPNTFSAEGDVFLGALENTFTPQLNAVVAAMNVDTAIVNQKAAEASASSQTAATSAASALSNSNVVPWVSNTTYPLNTVVVSQINFQGYRKTTGAVGGSTDPSADPTNWVAVGTSLMIISTRSTNQQLVRNDTGKLITVTGTFTQTFATPATLGSGWYVVYKNGGTGHVTVGSAVYGPGWTGMFQCDGVSITPVEFKASTGYMKVSDRKASGVSGGDVTSTGTGQAPITRTLNTVESNTIAGASLSNNAVTLPVGTYQIRATAPLRGLSAKLFFGGLVGDSLVGAGDGSTSLTTSVTGQIVLSTAQTLTLSQYYYVPSISSSRLGSPAGDGSVEVYAQLEIIKVA